MVDLSSQVKGQEAEAALLHGAVLILTGIKLDGPRHDRLELIQIMNKLTTKWLELLGDEDGEEPQTTE